MRYSKSVALTLALLAGAAAGQAGTVAWVDWLSATNGTPGSASGVATLGSTTVSVSYSGEILFAQTNAGTNYWIPSAPYLSSVVSNPPWRSEIIALEGGSTLVNTITFSSPVTDPVMAILSLGRANFPVTYNFDTPFDVLSYGTGYFGPGTLTELPGNVLEGQEGHGVIQFQGTVSSISWTVPVYESWHGFTFGIIPEPGGLALFALAALVLTGWRRRG